MVLCCREHKYCLTVNTSYSFHISGTRWRNQRTGCTCIVTVQKTNSTPERVCRTFKGVPSATKVLFGFASLFALYIIKRSITPTTVVRVYRFKTPTCSMLIFSTCKSSCCKVLSYMGSCQHEFCWLISTDNRMRT